MLKIVCRSLLLFSVLAAPAGRLSYGGEDDARPNMVIFLSDDHTWRDSSVYGSPDIRTPNMQRLASAGMTFDNAFVASPSCAPSRAALLTGLYPPRNGAQANHSRPHADLTKLPAWLQQLGYEVASFGKVGHYRQTAEYGFDIAKHYGYHDDVAVGAAIKWLRARKSDKPLCLFVGTNWPHVPWPEDISGIDPEQLVIPPNHVDTPESRQWRAKYVAAIRTMDAELGQVYDTARQVLGEETFFLHTSDHGAQWPFGKWNLYDDGVRTPMIVSWPGRIKAGARSNAMVSWIDVLPTLLAVAGGEPPSDIDGRSFLPVLEGEAVTHRDVIFTTHSGDGNYNVFPIRAAHTSDGWSYIRNLHPEFRFNSHVTSTIADNGYWPSWMDAASVDESARALVKRYQQRPAEELYHTSSDPWEQDNLIADSQQQSRVAELRRRVDDWMQETADPQSVFGQPQLTPTENRPNIVTVFIDDMGWSDLSCYGGQRTETEHIDRLAAEGLRFTQFYINSPICSPSRVALSTGQYPQRHRISSYLSYRQQNKRRGMANWLSPDAPMLSQQLHQAGYATGHFGKWHMGGQRDVGNAPLIQAYGFDRSLTNFEGLGPRVLALKDAYDGTEPKKHTLGSAGLGKGPIRWEDRSRVTAAFVDEALHFIDHAQTTNQPFFLNLWPDDVHAPFFPPRVLRDETDGSKRQLYYAVLDAMDQQLGKLYDRVRYDPALRYNTLILVMSDNGHEEGAGSADPLRGAKTWLYEGGIRSPLIVWGPKFVSAGAIGTTNEKSVLCTLDVNRSLYSFAGITPEDSKPLDGEDILPTLLGQTQQGRQAPIFWRRPPDRPGRQSKDNPDLAVRDGRWKYLVNYDGSQPQLYDLLADAAETTNLAESEPQVVGQLHDALTAWNAELPRDAGDPQWKSPDTVRSLLPGEFVNPIGEGADPWVIRDPHADRYLWCLSDGNRGIAIHASASPTSMGQRHVVWRSPADGPVSREVWAPELHFLDGRWHIYFAASDGNNKNHLTYVLTSTTEDPLGAYELHGPLATGAGADGRSPNIWAIDMTVLELAGQRYALWSGWDEPGSDRQYLYIAPLESPTKLGGPRVRLCDNEDFLWERIEPRRGERGLNEAPQVFQAKGRTAVVYSCGASWLPTYKLGMLELVGRDPMEPSSWQKQPQPVFTGTQETFGVGHSCFVRSPDGRQWWHVFHAKRDREPGWRRTVFAQPMKVSRKGLPAFGKPIAAGSVLRLQEGGVSGGGVPHEGESHAGRFSTAAFDYYGHHQFLSRSGDTIRLGKVPAAAVNDYRSGEKVIFAAVTPEDLTAGVAIDFHGNAQARDAGILFRTTGASVGYDAQRGYFAGLIPRTQLVILGRTDGSTWRELARAATELVADQSQQLTVRMQKDEITIWHNDEQKIQYRDNTFPHGAVGLRVVDTDASFSNFRLSGPSPAKEASK